MLLKTIFLSLTLGCVTQRVAAEENRLFWQLITSPDLNPPTVVLDIKNNLKQMVLFFLFLGFEEMLISVSVSQPDKKKLTDIIEVH